MSSTIQLPTDNTLMVDAAVMYAKLGFLVVPVWGFRDGICACRKGADCPKPGKHPIGKGWENAASSDVPTVRARFLRHGGNVGWMMGSQYVTLDGDGDEGKQSLRELALPETLTSESGSGNGEHRVFRLADRHDAQKMRATTRWRPGLDVRVGDSQIVVAPSRHRSGKQYRWTVAVTPAELPDRIYELLCGASASKKKEAPPKDEASAEQTTSAKLEKRARAYVSKIPPAVSGEGGHEQTFSVARKLRGFVNAGLAEEVARAIFNEYNIKCQPPWTDEELCHKWEQAKSAKSVPGFKVVPEIVISTDLAKNVDDAIVALQKHPRVFQRDGGLVVLTRDEEAGEDGSPCPGQIRIRPIKPATLTEILADVADWRRPKHKDDGTVELVPTLPSKMIVEATLLRGEWPGLRPLTAISESPFLRPNGSICTTPGYDPTTGFFYQPSADITSIAISDSIDHASARQAFAILVEPFEEFPWEDETAKAVAIAAVLTLVGRPAIRGPVPLIGFDKNVPGAGGTLAADTVNIIAAGRTIPRTSWPGDPVEVEKVLGALALEGPSAVCLDNVDKPICGGALDRVLTCEDRVKLRVLGQSQTPDVKWRALLLATGNNLSVTGDTQRRVLLARMESPMARPEDRKGFRHEDLRAWVRAHRSELLAAALTILAGYIRAGRPSRDLRRWGSFECWSDVVANAIHWASDIDVMQARMRDGNSEDPERGAIGTVLRDLPTLDVTNQGLSAKGIVSAIFPLSRLLARDAPLPDAFDDLRAAVELLSASQARGVRVAPDAKKLGYSLRKYKGRTIRGRRIEPAGEDRTGAMRWRSVQVLGAEDAEDAEDISTKTRAKKPDDRSDRDDRSRNEYGDGLGSSPSSSASSAPSGHYVPPRDEVAPPASSPPEAPSPELEDVPW